MKNILPAPPIEITRTIKEKILIISWTWFLLIFVYQNILYRFIVELNQSGKINFGVDFNPSQLVWGEHVLPNVIKIIVDLCIALLGGITVGYLITRARITFKFFYSLLSTVIQLYLSVIAIVLISAFAYKGASNESIGSVVFYVLESLRAQPLYVSFMIAGFALVFTGYYWGINLGMRFREENVFDMDVNRRDTFLDIKWFHWLWFWIPVGIYLRIMLWVIFSGLLAIVESLKRFKFIEIFGITVSSANEQPREPIGQIIFWGFLILMFFFIQLQFVWDLLTGKKIIKNKFISGVLIFLFSFIVPFLIMFVVYWLFNRK